MLTLVQIFPNAEHPGARSGSGVPRAASKTLKRRHYLAHLVATAQRVVQRQAELSKMFFLCHLLKEANLNFLSHSVSREAFPNNCFKWPKGKVSVNVLTTAIIVLNCHLNDFMSCKV